MIFCWFFCVLIFFFFFFSSRRRHTRLVSDWSSDVCSSDLCWAKLMGPYFVSDEYPRYPDLVPLAQAMVQAAPERVVWGTDWPHPSAREKMPNDGDLADLLAEWVPDEAQRRCVLDRKSTRLNSSH